MIRPPSINLARRPFRNNSAYYAVYSACLALLLAASVYNGWRFFAGGSELDRLREDVSFATERYMKLHDEVEAMKGQINTLDLAVINTKSSFAEGLILSRFFSWSLLFDRLEELIPPEVKIQRIAPNISTKRIEITLAGMSRSADAFLEFEGNLASSPFFSNVYPVREDQQEGQTEIKFNLAMDYIPAGKDSHVQTDGAPVQAASAAPGAEASPAAGSGDAAVTTIVGAPSGEAPPGPASSPQVLATEPVTQPADGHPAGGQPASGQAAAPPAPKAPASPRPAGSVISVSDISQMTDEQFIETFGYPEYMRARGKARRLGGKAGKGGKAGQTATPPADPNGVTP